MSGVTAGNKTYDGGTAATVNVAKASLSGLLAGDAVTVSATGVFADKNVGAGKAVTLSSVYQGADVGNYAIAGQAFTAANISAATLTYAATPASFFSGQAIGNVVGTVNGFAAGDTLANSTGGQLAWTSTAGATSQPGTFPIGGSGLNATNYVFAQATGNATALTLKPGTAMEPVRNAAAQLAADVFLPRASTQADALSLSSSIKVAQSSGSGSAAAEDASPSDAGGAAVNVTMTLGSRGPALQIVSGGMRLPGNIVNVNE